MEGNITQQLQVDNEEMQQMLSNAVAEALKAMPRPILPPWLEALADFVRLHPGFSLLILLAAIFVISAIIREVICSYLKTNEIVTRLKRIEEKLK